MIEKIIKDRIIELEDNIEDTITGLQRILTKDLDIFEKIDKIDDYRNLLYICVSKWHELNYILSQYDKDKE